MHEQLLVGIAVEGKGVIETLIPFLLDDGSAGLWSELIKGDDLFESDLGIEAGLQGGLQVMRVIMLSVIMTMITGVTV